MIGASHSGVGKQVQHVAEQHEHEQGDHEGEEAPPLRPHLGQQHLVDEAVGALGHALQPARHHGARRHAHHHQRDDHGAGDQHVQVGLGEAHGGANRAEHGAQLELRERVNRLAFSRHGARPPKLNLRARAGG